MIVILHHIASGLQVIYKNDSNGTEMMDQKQVAALPALLCSMGIDSMTATTTCQDKIIVHRLNEILGIIIVGSEDSEGHKSQIFEALLDEIMARERFFEG